MSRTPRLVIANENPKNKVYTTLMVDEAVKVLRENPSTGFVADLVRAYDRYKDQLHPNKKAWVLVIAQQTLNRANRVEAPATVLGNFDGISALFRLAGSRLKFPKIELDTTDGRTVVLALAGSRSQYAGQINVSSGHKYGDPEGRFYGRIATDGTTGVSDPGVLDLLTRFAADPAGVAAEYGRRVGQCCFCRLGLTDERSLLVGYGPVCADNYGLPWGSRPGARPSPEPEPDSGEFEAAIAAAELANERVGFASDPDYRRFLVGESRPLSLDALLEAAAASAVRDGYLPPRVERGAPEPVAAPWLDND